MELSVGLDHEDLEDQDVLRSEQTGCHLVVPDDVEVDADSHSDTERHQNGLD